MIAPAIVFATVVVIVILAMIVGDASQVRAVLDCNI